MVETDHELLARYLGQSSEDAFARLAERHLPLVHSAALRQVRSHQLAEEVAQAVFVNLANNASRLVPNTNLTAWLYQVTRREAIQVIRREARRQAREQTFTEMNATNSGGADWSQIERFLDEAMHSLDEIDRATILLRYFEKKSLREVGQVLGTSDDAAQKRVTRALERLCKFFTKRGITVGASALALTLSANAVQAAPLALVAAISTTAGLAAGSVTAGTVSTLTKIIAMTTLQKAAIVGCAVVLTGSVLYHVTVPKATRGDGAQSSVSAEVRNAVNQKPAKRSPFFSEPRAGAPTPVPAHLKIQIASLRALLVAAAPERGTRMYPPEGMIKAITDFGADRKEAFALLKTAASDADPEVRKRAISALWLVGRDPFPQYNLIGDPAPEAKPLLWSLLKDAASGELASYALSSIRNIGFTPTDIPVLAELLAGTTDSQLKRYLPEAIADTIRKNPADSSSQLSAVRELLNSPNAELRFEVACALSRVDAAQNPSILQTIVAGLKGSGLQLLMALETLPNLGTAAQPAVQSLMEFTKSTEDDVLRAVAFKTIGSIDGQLRHQVLEVDQALNSEATIAYWNQKFAAEGVAYPDLMAALKLPMFAPIAAQHLGGLGASAKEAVPSLIDALSGQDQSKRDKIVEAIHQIDPEAAIAKVNSKAVADAALAAVLTFEGKAEASRQTAVGKLLEGMLMVSTDWYTQKEVVELAQQIAARDPEVYRAFVGRISETEPGLAALLNRRTNP